MDHEYELEDDYAPRVLWGRIAFFVLAILLAFLAGRCTKSAGADPDEFADRGKQISDLTRERDLLQAQVDAMASEPPSTGGKGNKGNKGNKGDPSEPAGEDEIGEGQRYTVKEGDTLTTIAEEFYGDPMKYDLIVDANNLDGTTDLTVGQVLIIPDDTE
jgi:LysM repeat protein